MPEETSQSVEIRSEPNPWLYGPPFSSRLLPFPTQPNFLGYVTALIVFHPALAAWWLYPDTIHHHFV